MPHGDANTISHRGKTFTIFTSQLCDQTIKITEYPIDVPGKTGACKTTITVTEPFLFP